MHGISNSFVNNIAEKRARGAESQFFDVAEIDPFSGMRNLLPLQKSNAFGNAGGRNQDLRGLMRKLAARISREKHWPDLLPGATDDADNPRISSGYTYLLQLIAHDLVNTSISLSATMGGKYGVHNSRVQALSLDTIFGGGPDVCPHAYAQSRECRGGDVPRTRLRVGRSRAGSGGRPGQPANDLGRAVAVGVQDTGIEVDAFSGELPKTEALVADARNDDHALISQLTLLWHRLHNYIIGKIEPTLVGQTPAERAYHAFILSRFAVMLIYRKIVLYDVLGKLLHPIAFKYYVLDNKPRVAHGEIGIPVEFAHGAFRCGHVMVRNSYLVRGEDSETAKDTDLALMFSSQRYPDSMPVSEDWVVDWARFFPVEGRAIDVNHSRRIGPNFPNVLKSDVFFGSLTSSADGTVDLPGLHSRDLVSSIFANMWSVPALIDALRSRSPELSNFLRPYTETIEALTAWLTAAPMGAVQFADGDVEQIAANPPLPFFTLFEAALGDRRGPPFKGGGQHLGPLGSIIVAETILGAMAEFPLRVGTGTLDPQQPFATAAATLGDLGFPVSLAAEIPEIRSMPELLTFMRKAGIIV